MIEVELVGVRVEMPTNTPIVAVRELNGQPRVLSIFIGGPEATAISFALEGVTTPRPLTHDLMMIVFDTLGVALDQVIITDLVDGTFFAELHLDSETGPHVISCRPSDALALAARTECRVFVAESVMDEAAAIEVSAADVEDREPEDVVEEFRQFIENIDPEDFDS